MSVFYKKEIKEVIDYLSSDSDKGLTSSEANKRIERDGLNKIPESKPDGLFKIFLRQFKSPLIYLLVLAAIFLFYLGDNIDAFIIIFILLFNAVLGTIQEGKAQNALEALKKMLTSEALIVRDGKEVVVEADQLVKGDIFILSEGDKIPADARLISSNNLKVSESALTGESKPVSKSNDVINKDKLSVSDQTNMVFKGSYVVSGNGRAVVIATGLETVVGGISAKLSTIDTEVPLKKRIKGLSRLIITVILIMAGFIFSLGITAGQSAHDMLLIVIAIVVSSIPEGLPVVITLVLATGVWRMSKKNALVKRLQAVEALGQAKVIAVDKTGTITRNELMVSEIYFNQNNFPVSGFGYETEGEITGINKDEDSYILRRFAEVSAFTSDARVRYNEEESVWQVTGDPTEAAMRVFAGKAGVSKEEIEKTYSKVSEIPFSSDNKFHAVINKKEEINSLSLIGAPEVVISKSKYILENGEIRSINKEDIEKIEDEVHRMSDQGLRVLGLAFVDDVEEEVDENYIPESVFLGLAAMSDVKRRNVKDSVRRVHEAGVNLVMITGDHKITARAIAKQVGIYSEGDRVILGSELDSMTSEELAKVLPETTVFARVTPEHKLKIVGGYRALGQVVAMTGDGVNDALSLVSADLGVAMGKIGTEVAKEASDIILLDDNFASIISAMEEGRAIYMRIKRVILYLFSTSFGEVITITTAIMLGLPLPLLAAQIIWLNVVTDGILVAPLSMDPKEKNILNISFEKPKRWVVDGLMGLRIFIMGATMALVTIFLFYHYLPDVSGFEDMIDEHLLRKPWTISLTVLAVFQWFNVWNVRTTTSSIFSKKLFSNKWLLGAIVLAVLLQIMVVYVPFMQEIFRTTALDLSDWIVILTFGLTIVLVEEIRKMLMRFWGK